jgi:hypothetical protein
LVGLNDAGAGAGAGLYLNKKLVGFGVVKIINLNVLWGGIFQSVHVHSCDLDSVINHWESLLFVVVVVRRHSCNFEISDESTMTIGKGHKLWLVASQFIYTSDDKVRHWNYIPTARNDLLSCVQGHKLETSL